VKVGKKRNEDAAKGCEDMVQWTRLIHPKFCKGPCFTDMKQLRRGFKS
jgi:hypothetical protein